RAGPSRYGLARYGGKRTVRNLELDTFELHQFLELLYNCIFRFRENLDERFLAQLFESRDDRYPAHEFRYEAELYLVLGLHLPEQRAEVLFRVAPSELRLEPYRLLSYPLPHYILEPAERAP